MKTSRIILLLPCAAATLALVACDREIVSESVTVVVPETAGGSTPEPVPPGAAIASELPEDSLYHLSSKWRTQEDDEIALESLKGQVQVMAMGYSTCKFACPRLVADMKAIEAKIPEELRSSIGFVFVSIDPGTDTPEQLKQFASDQEFTPGRWRLLNGNEDAVLELSVLLGMKYNRMTATDFAHSNIISVLDPGGRIAYQQEGLGADDTKTLAAIAQAAAQ